MSDAFDDLLAFGLGKALFSGSTAAERENERKEKERQHQELMAALQGKPKRPQPPAQWVPTPAQVKQMERHLRDEQNSVRWSRGRFSEKNIITVGLKTKISSYHFRVKLPQIGTEINAFKPFMRLDIGQVQGMEVSIPFEGVVIERNQQAVDAQTHTQKGFWLLKIQLAEIIASCPFCNGGVLVGEQGGQTVACPHCQNHIVLPND